MGKIDLNENRFDDVKKIFNNGKAGVVKDLQVKVAKKTADDHPQAPPYNLVFVDKDGAEIQYPVFYLGDPTGNKSDDEQREVWLGSTLRHIWHAVVGEDTPLPEFDSWKMAVDRVMQEVSEHLTNNPELRFDTVVNYGNEKRPSRYLRVKKFPAFIERSGLTANESRLFLGAKDLTIPFVDDEESDDESSDAQTTDKTWDVS